MFGYKSVSVKDRLFVLLSFFYILYVIFPLFADYTNIPVFIPAIMVVAYIGVFYNSVFNHPSMKSLLIYIALLFIYSIIGLPIHINGMGADLPYWWRITIEAAWILPAVMISVVLFRKNEADLYRLFGLGSIVLLALSFLYIMPLLLTVSNILRDDAMDMDQYRPMGLPDYALMHSYTLMLLPLFAMVKLTSGRLKIIALTLSCLFFYVITQTSVTTNLFVSFFILLFVVLINVHNVKQTFVGAAVTLLVIFILYKAGAFLWLVDSLMPYFEDTDVAFKLQDFHDSLVSGTITGSSITGRMDYHGISKDNFWANPIIGGGFAGGHSKILDILGCSGLVVFLPFALVLWHCMKLQAAKAFGKYPRIMIYASYAFAGVYLYEKGIFGAPGFLFLLILVPTAIFYVCSLNQSKSS